MIEVGKSHHEVQVGADHYFIKERDLVIKVTVHWPAHNDTYLCKDRY